MKFSRYRAKRVVFAAKGKNGETIITANGPIGLTDDDYVVRDSDNQLTVMSSDNFAASFAAYPVSKKKASSPTKSPAKKAAKTESASPFSVKPQSPGTISLQDSADEKVPNTP